MTVFIALVAPVEAWHAEGMLPATSTFDAYAGKFCFDYVPANVTGQRPGAGVFDYSVTGRLDVSENQPGHHEDEIQDRFYLMVFDDRQHHWQRARPFWNELTCHEMLELSSWSTDLSPHLRSPPYQAKGTVTVHEGIRPRFWYFAFVNCGADISLPVRYTLHARNIHQGFQAEFGMDMRGSLPLQASFALFFIVIVVAICICTRTRSARLQHQTLSLLHFLQVAAMCSAAGCSFSALHHFFYAQDGKGLMFAAVLGTLGSCLAKAILTIMLFFIAKGWALLLTPDEQQHRCMIVAAVSGIIGLSVGCEVWDQYFHDRSTTFYLYESWPGCAILVLNMCLLGAALVFMWHTYQEELQAEIRRFYRLTSAAYGMYFAFLPLICLLTELFSPWVRRKYVERAEVGMQFALTLLLFICMRPSQLDNLIATRLKFREQPESELLTLDKELHSEA